jgi:hypothetical protein
MQLLHAVPEQCPAYSTPPHGKMMHPGLPHVRADVPYETASGVQYWLGEDGERTYQDAQACPMSSSTVWYLLLSPWLQRK